MCIRHSAQMKYVHETWEMKLVWPVTKALVSKGTVFSLNKSISTYVNYLQCSSIQQGSDSTHSQCTQISFFQLEVGLGCSCRTPLNQLLC